MRRILTLFITAIAFSLLPSISQAACRTTDGTVTYISVSSNINSTVLFVRADNVAFTSEPPKTYVFSSANANVLNLMLNAQASNGRVQVTGTGSDECTDSSLADSNGDNRISGGSVISVAVSR